MKLSQILKLIGGGIVAFLFAILGIQRKKIVKQKEEIKEKEEEVKQAQKTAQDAQKATEVVITHAKAKDAIDKQETANAVKIEEAEDEEELIDVANALIDSFNKSSRL